MTSLTKTRPLAPWSLFGSDLDRFFERLVPGWVTREDSGIETGVWAPRMDFSESDKEFIVQMDLPGIRKEDVTISLEDHELTISGERKEEFVEEDRNFHRIERFAGRFFRAVPLPGHANIDKASAIFKDGVLTIKIPKAKESKPHRIKIN